MTFLTIFYTVLFYVATGVFAIGLVLTLAIFQVLVTSEGRKRSLTGVNDVGATWTPGILASASAAAIASAVFISPSLLLLRGLICHEV